MDEPMKQNHDRIKIMKVVLFVSHGSKSKVARKEVEKLAIQLRGKSGLDVVAAFLDVNEPNIPQGIAECVMRGASKIIILLNFLNSGNHVLKDIPRILEEEKKKFPQVQFILTQAIGQHAQVCDLFLDLIQREV
jgi:sirohydrochlorin ferrochelatase